MVENIPNYPNFAQDVYQVICDHFSCLVEPLLTFALYDDIITVVGMFFPAWLELTVTVTGISIKCKIITQLTVI